MNCKCGTELTGRQKEFCSDRCRMQFKRNSNKVEQTKPEQGITKSDIVNHIASVGGEASYVERSGKIEDLHIVKPSLNVLARTNRLETRF